MVPPLFRVLDRSSVPFRSAPFREIDPANINGWLRNIVCLGDNNNHYPQRNLQLACHGSEHQTIC